MQNTEGPKPILRFYTIGWDPIPVLLTEGSM
jgi:hypothetical protein